MLREVKNLLVGNYFYPLGGSAFVLKALFEKMPNWRVEMFSGITDQTVNFFDIENIHFLNYTPAMNSSSPMTHTPPMHGANRDKKDSPDIIYSKMNDDLYKRQVKSWLEVFSRSKREPDLLYLSHLTPMHAAARQIWPDKPLITHLHGPELLFIKNNLDDPYYDSWRERMIYWGENSAAFFAAPGNEPLISTFWPKAKIFPIGNGIYPDKTRQQQISRKEVWQEVFLQRQLGQDSNGSPLKYSSQDINPLFSGPVFIASGRFTKVKQFPMLIEAWSSVYEDLPENSSLVIIGGFPGEVEGEHPESTISRTGAKNVFLAGWWPSEELPKIFSAGDVFLMPSEREQFGNVLLEAGACQLPALAVSSPGPETILSSDTGILVENGQDNFAAGLREIVSRKNDWKRMGKAARKRAIENFSQEEINKKVSHIFSEIISVKN